MPKAISKRIKTTRIKPSSQEVSKKAVRESLFRVRAKRADRARLFYFDP